LEEQFAIANHKNMKMNLKEEKRIQEQFTRLQSKARISIKERQKKILS